jgi:hypothetical protein
MVAVLLGAALAAAVFGRGLTFPEHAAVQESLARMPAKFQAEWLQRRGMDASRYTEYRQPESAGLKLVGKWGRGPSNEVTGRGDLVALTLGSEVALLNFANPDSPVVLSEMQFSFIPRQTVLHDSFLLTCGNGIEIWSIADSTHPVYRNVIPYGVGDFAVVDTFLYFASAGTFYAYSIGRPASPYELGRCMDSGYVTTATRTVAVARELDDVLGFIDVSNPAAPKRVGTYNTWCQGADARGSICVATKWWNGKDDWLWLDVLDISDPANPRLLGEVDSVGGYDIHLSGPLAFVSGFDYGWGFAIVDISDSTRPHVISQVMTPNDRFAVWADWTSNWAYVADAMGLVVLDISNISSPHYDTTVMSAHSAWDVGLNNGRACVADGGAGLRILDVTNPAEPTELGGLDSANIHALNTSTAVVQDSFAVMGWVTHPWLRVVDVSDPRNPRKVAACDLFNPAESMVWRDSFLYVAEAYRFQVVNISRPRQPLRVGTCVLSSYATDLHLVDTLAFLSGLPLTIVSVARPDSPKIVGTWNRGVSGLDVVDTILYAAGQNAQFWTLSVANPANPRPIDSLTLPSWDGEDVVVVGSVAYVGEREIRVVDVSDPANLRLAGAVSIPGWTPRLVYAAPYVYACCADGGVAIFETTHVAIAEPKQDEGRQAQSGASLVRGVLNLEVGSRQNTACRAELLDVSGREVRDLHPGANDVRALAPGVYFIREEPQAAGINLQAVLKVILTR